MIVISTEILTLEDDTPRYHCLLYYNPHNRDLKFGTHITRVVQRDCRSCLKVVFPT